MTFFFIGESSFLSLCSGGWGGGIEAGDISFFVPPVSGVFGQAHWAAEDVDTPF